MAMQYTQLARTDFEQFLDNTAEYEQVDVAGVNELVYDLPLPADHLSIRVFSTIEDGAGRGLGEDAIRTVVWNHNIDAPVGGKSKTLRIGPSDSNPEGWRANLRPKISELYANWRNFERDCPECGSTLALREGSYGAFYGCSDYPNCTHTQDA